MKFLHSKNHLKQNDGLLFSNVGKICANDITQTKGSFLSYIKSSNKSIIIIVIVIIIIKCEQSSRGTNEIAKDVNSVHMKRMGMALNV